MSEGTADALRGGRKYLGVHGLGYIGYSTAAYFGRAGIRVIGYDPVPERVNALNTGTSVIPNLDLWIGFPTKDLPVAGTEDVSELLNENVVAQFVAVPTEKDGMPWDEPLLKVMDVLNGSESLVLVESTLTLTMAERAREALGRDFAVANRRDWFGDRDKTLATLPRVVGSPTPVMTREAADVCRLVSPVIHETGFREAVLVKALENALRYVDIAVVNELVMGYPDIDVREVARLAGTKWNVETYHPGLPGGYCLELACKYLIEGSGDNGVQLHMLHEALEVKPRLADAIMKSILATGSRRVAVLGLCYKDDIPVHVLSGGVLLAKALAPHCDVLVNDPYFSDAFCAELTGGTSMPFPEILKKSECVVLFAGHRAYASLPDDVLRESLRDVHHVLDFGGVWRGRTPEWVNYRLLGGTDWRWNHV